MALDRQSRRRRAATLVFGVGGTVLAALLWGRLKLVTGIPRTAYAEPEGRQTSPAVAGAQTMRVTSEKHDPSLPD